MTKYVVRYIYIVYKHVKARFRRLLSKLVTQWLFYVNNVEHLGFKTKGVPFLDVGLAGSIKIGNNLSMNNGLKNNTIGCPQPCSFVVSNGAQIIIGENVGMSQATLVAKADIIIGDNVKIGGGTFLYTSDFHSLDPKIRASGEDLNSAKNEGIVISDNAFIGSHCIILKGVKIGRNSIIGAGSIVTKCVPDNQIWAGNPAKFIKEIIC